MWQEVATFRFKFWKARSTTIQGKSLSTSPNLLRAILPRHAKGSFVTRVTIGSLSAACTMSGTTSTLPTRFPLAPSTSLTSNSMHSSVQSKILASTSSQSREVMHPCLFQTLPAIQSGARTVKCTFLPMKCTSTGNKTSLAL